MSEKRVEQPVEDDTTNSKSLIEAESIKKSRRIFSVLAILMVVIAQIQLSTTVVLEDIGKPISCTLNPFSCNIDSVSWGVYAIIFLLFAGITLFIWGQKNSPPVFWGSLLERFQITGAKSWVITSFVLSLLAVMTMQLFERAKLTNYIPVLILWFFAALCYFVAFKNTFSMAQLIVWFKLHRNELIAIGLVTVLGIILRLYKLGDLPRVVNGDEGRVGIAALSTFEYPYVNPFALWENFGALYLQAINLLLSLLGPTPFSLRLVAAIGGSLAIPAVYLLARQISGYRVALIAAGLLAVSHTHLHFSRTVAVAYIQGTWIIPLEFYFLLSGITKRSSWRTALSGMLLAFHYSIYLDAQIITALILVYMVIAFIFLRPWIKLALRQVAVFWGGFAIMLLPEFVYIWEHPAQFFERLSKDGMFQSGWLQQQVNGTPTLFNVFPIIAQRIAHTFLSMIYYPSFDFYGSPTPVLSLFSAVLFLLGLGLVLWKTRSPGFLILNGHFWSGILAIAIFSLPPSADTYRVLIVLPVALIMAAIALDYVLEMLDLGWARARTTYVTVAALIVVSLMMFNTWTYYADFLGKCRYGIDDSPTRFASYMGNYVRDLDIVNDVYLLSDNIYINGTHQSVAFLSHNREIVNLPDSLDTVQLRHNTVIIASPNRIAELQAWVANHPDGKIHEEYDCGTLMLFTYQIP